MTWCFVPLCVLSTYCLLLCVDIASCRYSFNYLLENDTAFNQHMETLTDPSGNKYLAIAYWTAQENNNVTGPTELGPNTLALKYTRSSDSTLRNFTTPRYVF